MWIFVLLAVFAAELSLKYMTVFMFNANAKETAKNELYITSYLSDTNVVVTVNRSPFKKELSMQGGERVTVEVPSDTELIGTGKYSKTVMIQSNEFITIVSTNRKKNSLDTSLVYPVTEWGQEYYIFTPAARGYRKEFAVFGLQDSTFVTVELKCTVTFEGKTYKPNEKLTTHIYASEVLYLESNGDNEDCTGSSVVSDKPVGVISGHACAWKNSKCQHTFEQLLPVERWGSYFIVPPLEYQVLMDSVFIFAYKPTRVSYKLGAKSENIDLNGGQRIEILMDRSSPMIISSTQPVQVLYYCTGGKFSDNTVFDPFIMNIIPTNKFCEFHTLEGMEGFTNYALIVAKTKNIKEVQFDDKRPTFKWLKVEGTEYSWAHYTYDKGRSHHTMKSPRAPIGVYSVGTVDQNSYGAPAACGLLTCAYKGKFYLAGKYFWDDSACTVDCVCNPSTGSVNCWKSKCNLMEECKVVAGVSRCVETPTEVEPAFKYMTVFMFNANANETATNELYITSYLSDTKVVVRVTLSPFKKELSMQGGERVTVEVPSDTELIGTGIYSKTVVIQSNRYITIVSANRKKNSLDTTLVYPVTEFGQEYYIFTPSAWGYPKEFAVFGLKVTLVTVELTCTVTFEGKTYKPNQKLTIYIYAYGVLYLESNQNNEDCTGSRVVSDKPVGVISGHACAWKNSKCQHTFEQLLPVKRWGTYFIVPPLQYQVLMDSVFIFAYKPTHVIYQFGAKSQEIDLRSGQWKEIQMDRSSPLVISSILPIQVLYYCNGGKFSDNTVFDPFIMNIEPTDKFCESRTLEGMKDFTNYALIVAKTNDINKVIFDDNHPSFKWLNVEGTEYSWAHYTYDKGRSHHTMKSPRAPIGVYSVGTVDQNSYGAPAACGLLTCTYKGKSYLPEKRFWEDSACTQLCECNPSTGFVDCQKSQCKAGEECKVIEGHNECVAKGITAPAYAGEGKKTQTNVVVTIYKYPVNKEVDTQGSKSVTVEKGTPEIEIHGAGKYLKTTDVQTNKVITIAPESQVNNSVDVSLEYPVSEWGRDYYVFTPPARGYQKQLAVFSGPDASSVSVDLSCTVSFRGKTYNPRDKLTVNLGASEIVYLQSDEDCTGSRVVSDKPIGVISGHACDLINSKCQHTLKQLLPVNQWGTSYIIPPLEYQVLEDSVYIFASKPTDVTYQFGAKSQVINLSAGQWKALPMGKNTPLVISSTQPIQVLYYCNGGRFSDGSVFDTFIMNIVPTDKFCQANVLEDMDGLNNYALIVAKTKDINEVQFDNKRPSFKWQQVQGTEYSWAPYTYEKGNGHHIVLHPFAPIRVYCVGTAKQNGYGAPVSCARFS